MEIEKEIFKRARLKKECLLPYGFKKEGDHYLYKKEFMDSSFRAEITVKEDGSLSGKVIDLEFGDEYRNFRIENQSGAFVNQVREEYSEILLEIRKHCYQSVFFIGEQANRIAELVKEKFNDEVEFPFEEEEVGAIFRHPGSGKWYGIIMNIRKNRILPQEEGEIEVMNVKLDPEEIETLLKKDHYFPAYHMNKKYWITLPLDDSLKDEKIIELLGKSRNIVATKKKK